ncbi:hypothetical protein [Brucella intermedia]|nr:hypothetical protein [Brucella intermedia]
MRPVRVTFMALSLIYGGESRSATTVSAVSACRSSGIGYYLLIFTA